jgi:CRP-like cAMP-binding protein
MTLSLGADIEILARIPFFEGFSDEHLRLIAFSAESRSLPEKLLLYEEGQLLHSAYVVVSGRLRGERKPKDGAPTPALSPARSWSVEAGQILGERTLILDTRAAESVRVESRARVLQIRKTMFRRLLQEYPEIAIALRGRLARKLADASAALAEVGERLSAIPD